MGVWSKEDGEFTDILNLRYIKLFKSITSNPNHVLRDMLPERKLTKYELRNADKSYILPFMIFPHDTCNYIIRKLYESHIS